MDEPISFVSNPISVPLRLLHVGRTQIDHQWNWRQLRAPYWRLYVNDRAGATIHPDSSEPVPIPPNNVIAIPAWLDWSSTCQGNVGHHVIHVQVVGLPSTLAQRLWPRPVLLGQALAPAMCQAIVAWQSATLVKNGWRVQSLVTDVFAQLAQQLPHDHDGLLDDVYRQRSQKLQRVLHLIDERLHRPLSVQELADFVHVSPATLNRLFRRELACSPASYLRERRVGIAAEELIQSSQSIDGIAQRVGFADRYALSKAFAAVLGCGPAAYRKSQRRSLSK